MVELNDARESLTITIASLCGEMRGGASSPLAPHREQSAVYELLKMFLADERCDAVMGVVCVANIFQHLNELNTNKLHANLLARQNKMGSVQKSAGQSRRVPPQLEMAQRSQNCCTVGDDGFKTLKEKLSIYFLPTSTKDLDSVRVSLSNSFCKGRDISRTD